MIKIHYTLILLIGLVYSNDYAISGTGLELDRIDDYEVDVLLHNTKNLDFDFNEHSLETYVTKYLFERALDQNKKYSENRLNVNIEFGSYIGNGGFETRVWLSFFRPGTYIASKVKYKKLSQVWRTDNSFIFSNPNHTKFESDIMKIVEAHLEKFSISLLKENK
tara:strand:+ start:466 stop:957 length:492 start_codon:yes stop_codon:yes gene_type:complete